MSRNTNTVIALTPYTCEAEIVEGLDAFAAAELRAVRGVEKLSVRYPRPDAVSFSFSGQHERLFQLRTIQSINRVFSFPVPRPKGLLGDQHFKQLVAGIRDVMALHPADTFRTLGIAAAGAQSTVMQRLRSEMAHAIGLQSVEDKGDLQVRIRPAPEGGGWQCLVRLTPRPLATRSWRVRNYAASLNATVAYVMSLLTQPNENDVYVNLCSGSGSLLVERLALGMTGTVMGVERDPHVQMHAMENLAAAGHRYASHLLTADVRTTPFPDRVANAITADLPFGQASGSHQENIALYPAILKEAARIALPNACFVAITHEVHLFERQLSIQNDWRVEQSLMITLRGLHPRVYVLRRV
ncbi:MAG: RNA methyltransferase [Chloroflexota bacterium]|nr:RNA methyltransferase [Chloroflexota bacterium]